MPVSNEQIEKLLKENLEYNKAIFELAKKTKRYMLMAQIMGILKILIIVVPLILALIYLPSLIKGYTSQFQDLMGEGDGGGIMEQLQR